MTSLPFPLVEVDDEHPSGCGVGCEHVLHLTPRALMVLRRAGVPEDVIQAALRYELRAHTAGLGWGLYPRVPPWNPQIEATLTSLGVPPGVIAAAHAQVLTSERRRDRTTTRALVETTDRVAAWKAANKPRVAEHSRAYRARKKLERASP